jgi:S-DNA-T family DNA segregation ATPase FtsK/SpoIIIE
MARDTNTGSRATEFLGLLCFALALMLFVSLGTYSPEDPVAFFKVGGPDTAVHNFIGPTGAFLAELLVPQLFGLAAILIPLVLGTLGWTLFWCRPIRAPYTKAAGLLLLLLSLSVFFALTFDVIRIKDEPVRAGGAVGQALAGMLTSSFSRGGAFIIDCTAFFAALILSTQFSFASLLTATGRQLRTRLQGLERRWAHYRETRRKDKLRRDVVKKHAEKVAPTATVRERKPRPTPPAAEPGSELPLSPSLSLDLEEVPATTTPRAPQAATRNGFPLPPLTILDEIKADARPDAAHLFEKAKTLQNKAREFGVMGTVAEIHPGPVVTTYEFKPDAGIKYSKIVGLADDLALALEAESIRIDRMSGRGSVAIEIPNDMREMISLREIIQSEPFQKSRSPLTLALGKAVNGDTAITDLTQMPHLLIAGATGTGKSVGLNCMITSILFKSTPDEVRLLLIDPKRLELGVYEDVPHLLAPVVTDPKIASNVLKWAVGEMERRIRTLASEGVRNIEQYNNILKAERGGNGSNGGGPLKPLHYIVVVIDELADLMMVSSNDVEESITRLAQMARAVGIHLILATQRPSVDVITGLIKANFPSRISFKVSARVDSRTILDSIGAEHLLGRGDMLFLPPGSARLLRIHGAYVTEHEIARLTSYLRKLARPTYDDSVGKVETRSEAAEVNDRDELYDEAARFVVQSGQASTSMLQRRFRIGFSRAGRLVDMLERDGIVGPADGSKAREILVAADYYESVDNWPR